MVQDLPPIEAKLYKRCDEVLHYVWDPIGVSGSPYARDEYDSYLSPIFALVNENASTSKIVEYLVEFESGSMGLSPNKKKAREVAEILLEWRVCINESTTRRMLDNR